MGNGDSNSSSSLSTTPFSGGFPRNRGKIGPTMSHHDFLAVGLICRKDLTTGGQPYMDRKHPARRGEQVKVASWRIICITQRHASKPKHQSQNLTLHPTAPLSQVRPIIIRRVPFPAGPITRHIGLISRDQWGSAANRQRTKRLRQGILATVRI